MIGEINNKINQLEENAKSDVIEKSANLEFNQMQETNEPPVEVSTDGSVFAEQEQPILVAGAKTDLIKEILRETLQAPGARISREIKTTKNPRKTIARNIEAQPIETPAVVPAKPKKLKLSAEEDVQALSARRQEIISQGATPVSPVPSPTQLINNVGEGKLSTVPYDEEGLRATLQASAEAYLKEPNAPVTIADLYDNAIKRGLPKAAIQNVLMDIPFESKVGDYQLAKNTAGLIRAMDESTSYVDELMAKLEKDYANFSDTDMFNLAQQMAIHKSLMDTTLSVGSDVSATLNTFRRAKETMGTLGGPEFKQFLDGIANKDEAFKLAKLYNSSRSVASKNKLLANQKGLLTKLGDGAWYTYQSNLLSDVSTWAFNFVGATTQNALMFEEDLLIAGVTGPVRRMVTGAKDGYYLEDVFNGMNGLYNGLANGWEGAAKVVATGKRAGYKSEGKINPISAENLSNTPLLASKPDMLVTPDLTGTWIGKLLDGTGFFQEISFRALAAGDEITSTAIADVALNREASAFARQRYDELMKAGTPPEDIKRILVDEVAEFKDTQPIDMYKTVEETRQLANLSYAWDKMYTLDRGYARVEAVLNAPVIKTFIPFAPTITRVFDQAASRVPGMQVISPQFYKDMNKGGVYADRAMARVISGGIIPTMLISTGALENKITGGGPGDPQLKRALENTGWQEYSLVFNKSTFGIESLNRLKAVTNVTESTDGSKVYISYQRFDQVGQIVGATADYAESLKMHVDKPDSEEWQKYAMATAAYVSEFTSQAPIAQFVGNIVSSLRGNYEESGQMVVEVFENLASAFAKRAVLSVPGISYAAGTQSAHIAKLMDRPQTTRMQDTMAASAGKAALEKIKNEMAGRIPLLRGEVEKELDYAGREVINRTSIFDAWINGIPFVKAKAGTTNELDETLVANKTGISKPSPKWEGVTLGAEQYNKFKRLYGQEVQLPIPVYKKDKDGKEYLDTEMMNMEKAIPLQLKTMDKIHQEAGLPPLLQSERKAEINKVVSQYRKAAKSRMIGDMQETIDGVQQYVYYEVVKENGRYGAVKKLAEHQDLAGKIDEYKIFTKVAPQ
jgi:hypothetical protein